MATDMNRLAVFDLDGTLLDTAPDICVAANRQLALQLGNCRIELMQPRLQGFEFQFLAGDVGRKLGDRPMCQARFRERLRFADHGPGGCVQPIAIRCKSCALSVPCRRRR
jgi:FMN phosphatase YigB (HAD superfamily)